MIGQNPASADRVVDPGALGRGRTVGGVVFQGRPADLARHTGSRTGQHLAGRG